MDLLDDKTQQEALLLARETIATVLFGKKPRPSKAYSKALKERRGVFITLYKNDEVRGCVGFYETSKRPLYVSIRESAAMSLNDQRFKPVTKVDADKITIEVSIITRMEKVDDWRKLVLGKHGVVIKKRWYWGGLLPNQMVELGLDLEGCLGFVCEVKAGLSRKCYLDPEARIYAIETQRFKSKLLT